MDDLTTHAQTEATRRRDMLAGEMERQISADHAFAQQHERFQSVLLASISAAVFVATLVAASGPPWLPRWATLAIGSLAAALVAWKAKADHRTTANWFYERRDRAQRLRQELLYQSPYPVTVEYISSISRRWTEVTEQLGQKMAGIHSRRKS